MTAVTVVGDGQAANRDAPLRNLTVLRTGALRAVLITNSVWTSAACEGQLVFQSN